MSFTFEAAPKVVSSKPKFRHHPEKAEQQYVSEIREKLKVSNMQTQLKVFKETKRISPYDIKPLPNPRIPVNLDFFLIDNSDEIPKKTDVETQIDEFLPLPPPKPYVPMKTGIDTMTQVEDHELFDFEREVLPMVQVISTKTLEQSLLEIAEEEELEALELFKESFRQKKQNETELGARKVQEEMKQVQYKNETLWATKDLEKLKTESCYRMIGYAIGRNYLQRLLPNTVESLYNLGFFQDPLQSSLHLHFLPSFIESTSALVQQKIQMKDGIDSLISSMDNRTEFSSVRKEADSKTAAVIETQRVRRVNFLGGSERRLRLVIDEEKDLNKSLIARELPRFSEGNYEEFATKVEERIAALASSLEIGDITEEEAIKTLSEELVDEDPTPYSSFFIPKISKLAFTKANNLFYRVKGSGSQANQVVFMFDGERNLVGEMSSTVKSDYFEIRSDIRDRKLPYSQDSALIIDFSKLPENVEFLLFTLESMLPAQNFDEAVCTLCDWDYLYTLASVPLAKFNDLPKPDINDETPLYSSSMIVFSGSKCRNEWRIEAHGHSKNFEYVKRKEQISDIESFIRFFNGKKPYLKRLSENGDSLYEGKRTSRIFKANLSKGKEGFEAKIQKILSTEIPSFLESASNGYEILVNNRTFSSAAQLQKIRRLGQVTVKAIPPPPEEPAVEEGEENAEKTEEEQE